MAIMINSAIVFSVKNSQSKEKVPGGVLSDGEAGPFEVHKGHR